MMRRKEPLTITEYGEILGTFSAIDAAMCSTEVDILNSYPLKKQPRFIKSALKRLSIARKSVEDFKWDLEEQFYIENPNYKGILQKTKITL